MRRRRFVGTMGRAVGALSLLPAIRDLGPRRQADAFRLWTWVHGGGGPREGSWSAHFARLKAAGVYGVLVGGGDVATLAAAAHDQGLVFHRWIWVLNRNGDEWARRIHPEWFTVSRNGESSLDRPPYVDYYRWVCPRRAAVRLYLRDVVRPIARQRGVDGVHLDYIRYPDVILPRGLWSKYGLVQDRELPEFDFCYCDVCRSTFAGRTGIDPIDLPDPAANEVWREFRWESVSLAVGDLARVVHREGKTISAAVFPTPTLARRLVRQAWEKWPLDAVFPMIYHSFYQESLAWIGAATRDGVAALAGRLPLYSGLYLPSLSPDELGEALRFARGAGAAGAAMFESGGLSEAHLARLTAVAASNG